MTLAPVHPDTRTCLGLLWALAVTELLAALLRDLGLALRLLQQMSIRRTGTVAVGQILARKRGLPFLRCHTRVRFRAATFPLCGGQAAPSAAASHVHLSDARSCDRTLSAEHGNPLPRDSGAAT